MINGIDADAVKELIGRVAGGAKEGQTRWKVTTPWTGGARTETQVNGYRIGGR